MFVVILVLFFFFSSRRRHTRCGRDWSSDVCSSDLCTTCPHTCKYPLDFNTGAPAQYQAGDKVAISCHAKSRIEHTNSLVHFPADEKGWVRKGPFLRTSTYKLTWW